MIDRCRSPWSFFILLTCFLSGLALSVRPAQGQKAISQEKTRCTDGTADQYPCDNVDLLSHLPISALGGDSGTSLNDIWGWTDPATGAEYAIIGRTDGTAFVEVSDPTNPVYLGELPSHSGSSTWRDVKVYKNHAYVVSEASDHGLQVFDLTQLRSVDNPPNSFSETAHYDRFSRAHNIVVNPESGYAYAVGVTGTQDVPSSADCGAGLHIIDIRTPDQPQFAGCHLDESTGGQVATGYTHDAQCVTYQGPDSDHQGDEICFNANESQLNIADVTEKDRPETIANATYPQSGYVHQAWLTEDQRYLLVDDETDERDGLVDKTRTLVFDVSNLENPSLVTSYSGPTEAIDHNQYVDGAHTYQANYESGLRVLNVADPERPVEVAFFDTYPSSNAAAFNGAWSTYPFFDSGMIIVSSIGEGLFVLDPTFPPFGAPTGLAAEPDSAGQTVTLQWGPSSSKRTASSQKATGTSTASKYRIYRSTAPIDSSSGPADRTPLDSVSIGTFSFTDTTVTRGSTYYYRITAVDSTGSESHFSNEAQTFLYPQTVSAAVDRSFGDAARSSDYRLVALPGREPHPLSTVISGSAGTDWQAYYDDGSDEDFLVKFDGSDRFVLRPGNGLWLTAQANWTFTEDAQTVELKGDSVAQIPLRSDWNVISNPTDRDVSWARVQAQTPDTLQTIWDFDGSFSQADTFRSARTGRAYYFFNDNDERDTLAIPYPGDSSTKTAPRKTGSDAPLLTLTATHANQTAASSVQVGLDEHASVGMGPEDLMAPPGQFEPIHLRLAAPGPTDAERSRFLMTDLRPPAADGGGHTFDVTLRSRVEGRIQLTTEHTEALRNRSLALLHPSASATYDLHERTSVSIEPEGQTTDLKVAIGTADYVEEKASDVLPNKATLAARPNPMHEQGTLTYALPAASEVTLRIYDVLGREVALLEQGRKKAGRHSVRLETSRLSSGVYIGRLETGNRTVTKKITVVR